MIAVTADRSLTSKGRRARDRILRAAEPLLATHGFHGMSMRDLAAAAKLPLATVVYHFARKEQLYAAVLAEIGGELERVIDDAVRERDRAARISTFAARLVRWMLSHPQRVQLVVREALDNPGRVARASRLPLAGVLIKAAAFIAGDRGAGAPAGQSPEYAFLHLFGGLSFVIVARPTIDRISRTTGPRTRLRADRYEREAVAFVRGVMGLADEGSRHERSASARALRRRE